MKLDTKRLVNKIVAITTLFCMATQTTLAALLDLSKEPLFIGVAVAPKVMLNVPKDHQLFGRLYSDFNDINDDGVIDTGYTHSIDYYGYFDPFKCYTYTGGRFDPAVSTPTKYCTGQWSGNFLNWAAMARIDAVRKLLYGGFRTVDQDGLTVLERASITTDGHSWAKYYSGADIDRLTPFTGIDFVERTHSSTTATTIPAVSVGIPHDSLPTRTFNLDNSATGRYLIKGDQVRIQAGPNNFMYGVVDVATTGLGQNITFRISASTGAAGPFASWTITNLSSTGITLCNTTTTTANLDSHLNINTGVYPPTTTYPPLIRVARGNYGLWAATDGKMCQWSGNINGNIGSQTRAEMELLGTSPAVADALVNTGLSELKGSRESPILANVGLTAGGAGPDFIARIKVCDAALLGTEKCRNYDNGNWKPIGLLQQYSSGNSKLIEFGLMTPSYSRNESGGVLRKKVGFLDARPPVGAPGNSPYTPVASDEIDPTTGVFRAAEGLIKTLNSIQLFGYGFTASPTTQGLYNQGNDNCGTPGLVNPPNDNCSSWGNPISEMYVETLRYLAGRTATSNFVSSTPPADQFSFGGLTKDDLMNLRVQGWSPPITNQTWCAPLNVIVMNSNVSSYDANDVPTDIFPAGTNAKTYTRDIGLLEGFTTVLAGSNTGPILIPPFISGTDTSGLGLCTPKAPSGANGFGDITGICPEAPVISGSFLVAGAAKWARENRISSTITKPDGTPIPASNVQALRVNTYGITLSGASPRIKIAIPGSNPTRFVTILPTGRSISSAGGNPYVGVGSILDFKVVRQDATSGKFFVSQEDSQQGNDYDLDSWGVISYEFLGGGTQIRVTTDVIYGAADFALGFGFVISGVTGGRIDATGVTTYGDGAHFLSAHRGGNPTINCNPTGPGGPGCGPVFNWPPVASTIGGVSLAMGAECTNCQSQNGPRSITFNIASGATSGALLEDPLYYAAKYGNFRDFNQNGVRDPGEWDQKVSGQPDNFFFVTNPAKLEEALEASFISILSQSSAASVATNSTSLQTNTTIYQARFNANDWSGNLVAFVLGPNGQVPSAPTWEADDLLTKAVLDWNARTVITYSTDPAIRDGVPFRLANLSPDLLANLNTNPQTAVVDGRAQARLDYLRGDSSNEGAATASFRTRAISKLGDIVNSNPMFVGPPNAGFGDSAYAAFRQQFANRKPMLFVGAGDGMLHAFSANENGKEYMAYIPSKVFPHLNQLTNKTYKHRYYVDGSPEVADAFFNVGGSDQWRTVLVGTLGAGGQGLFALDVTDPEEFRLETNANRTVLWEFTDSDDPNLGYMIGQPVIRKMNSASHPDGRWAAIVSGGYNNHETLAGETACTDSTVSPRVPLGCTTSSTGHAYLFIIFLDGPSGPGRTWVEGTDYIKISTGPATLGTPIANGLASPAPIDTNIDGKVDFIYAGDLLGNLIKFDVRSTNPSQWTNSSNQVVLFTANTGGGSPVSQPITSKPEVVLHPTGQGFLIAFGTGKYLEPHDPDAPYGVQSFYGIWDKNDSATTVSAQSRATSRLQLLEQTISTVTSGGTSFRVVSTNPPDWSALTTPPGAPPADSPPKDMGWFMDFPSAATTGERSVFRPIITGGRLIFTTLIPNTAPCEAGGTSFLMVINPSTGGRIDGPVLDVDANGLLNSADKVSLGLEQVFASGVQSKVGITPTPTLIRAGSTGGSQTEVLGGSTSLAGPTGADTRVAMLAGSSLTIDNPLIGFSSSSGRVSWREILAE